jgi:hypothetical protein
LTAAPAHVKSAGMKSLIFLVITFSLNFVMAEQTVSGLLGKSVGAWTLTPEGSDTRFVILPENDDVSSSLGRLSPGDFISGQAGVNSITKKISFSSIDYVGLKKLLGAWTGGDGLMVFKDFSRMKYSPRFTKSSINIAAKASYQKEFRYTLAPSDGEEWALFLSDDKSTTFATLQFESQPSQILIMKIYESESGNIIRTLKLERP